VEVRALKFIITESLGLRIYILQKLFSMARVAKDELVFYIKRLYRKNDHLFWYEMMGDYKVS
jgi:hypothetical protein